MCSSDRGRSIFLRMVDKGLKPNHTVLDVGCGNLQVGRYLIGYLMRERYYGIEPYKCLIEDGSKELPQGMIGEKKPQYSLDHSFNIAGIFPCSFDFILMSSIWTHASHWQIESLIRTAFRVATRDAVIIADYMDGEPDYEGTEWSPNDVVSHKKECITFATGGLWGFQLMDREASQWCLLHK